MPLKQKILDHLITILDRKIEVLKQTIQSTKESRATDTKSSAGDKFETGRAMMQMEIEKNEVQLNKTLIHKNELGKIKVDQVSKVAAHGSIVNTDTGNYFFSLPLGKIIVEKKEFICISMGSPIGQVLLGVKKGDTISFQNRKIKILKIE